MGRAVTLLVCGDAGPAGELAGELCALGFAARPVSPSGIVSALASEPADAIVTMAVLDREIAQTVRAVVSLAGAFDGAHAVIVPPAHPIQIAARVRSTLRLGVLEETATQRLADLGDAGHVLHKGEQKSGPICILYAGPPDPAYLRLEHALERAGAETVAAFSTFNAFDYLHERAFDAVVLNTRPKPDIAHTVCSAMRRNTRLYHTPTVLLSHDEVYRAADEAFARGASDILPASLEADELAERILALAQERRRRRLSKGLLESCRVSAVLDSETDLFSDSFGQRHLSSLVQLTHARNLPLSVIGLKVSVPGAAGPADGRHASGALNQFASMLRHCVRAEDLAVRVSANTFYLALPGTSAHDAQVVAARVAAIAECTAYEGADPQTPFRIVLRHDVTDAAAGDRAQTLVARAFANLRQEHPAVAVI